MKIKNVLLRLLSEKPLPAKLLVREDRKPRWWTQKLLSSSDYYISMGPRHGVFRK